MCKETLEWICSKFSTRHVGYVHYCEEYKLITKSFFFLIFNRWCYFKKKFFICHSLLLILIHTLYNKLKKQIHKISILSERNAIDIDLEIVFQRPRLRFLESKLSHDHGCVFSLSFPYFCLYIFAIYFKPASFLRKFSNTEKEEGEMEYNIDESCKR